MPHLFLVILKKEIGFMEMVEAGDNSINIMLLH